MPSGYHPVGSGALTTLIISATQTVTAGHGARCGGDSDQHGKPWAEGVPVLAFQAPLLFSASGWSLCLVRRDAEVELLPAGTDLGQ